MKSLYGIILVFSFLMYTTCLKAQNRWKIGEANTIIWHVKNDIPHYDHIEMSGLQMSTVLRYGVNKDGSLSFERSVIWPMLRTLPNHTHASLMQRFAIDYPSLLLVNGLTLSRGKVKSIQLDGRLSIVSQHSIGYNSQEGTPVVELTSTFFPSVDKPMLCERYSLKNISGRDIYLSVPAHKDVYKTDAKRGKDGSYTIVASIQQEDSKSYSLKPNEECTFHTTIQAYKAGQEEVRANVSDEEMARMDLVNELGNKLQFISPNEIINKAFSFAKVRASESIFKTKGGFMHGPGGESYYAAIWANDQAEYVNPFFPYLGYEIGNQSALNSFKHFARFMNDEYKPIPSSIIAEGDDIWNGAGDRGDGAMIAYGAARYALAKSDKKEAEELWPLIEWCLEYCKQKMNESGVVSSDSDELEGRFPAGDANLCTSSLYYDALLSAGYLAKELRKSSSISKNYFNQAEKLKKSIDQYFGRKIEGFDTYQYYEGNTILRSWIAIPLTVGIYERKEGTIEALFSPRLWTKNGLLTQAGTETFWDRSTLYALRGVYAAGERNKATEYLKYYSSQRLLGEHVPYPIEAWPEGSQRHLSAESGLFCRIVTEGVFGIRPTGFKSFELTPQLPDEWNEMELKNIQAFGGNSFDVKVDRIRSNKIRVSIIRNNKTIKSYKSNIGNTLQVHL